MKPETAGKFKYGGWGIVCGAIIAMIVGFGWGGWSTAATTQKMSEESVLASQAAICVAQFMKQPANEEKLKAPINTSSCLFKRFSKCHYRCFFANNIFNTHSIIIPNIG